jgi:predicted TIM-barrel fold metal-dependent hydrolase
MFSEASGQEDSRYDGPIIDMHLHAESEIWAEQRLCFPKPCEGGPTSVRTVDELKPMTLEAMQRNGVVMGVVSGFRDDVLAWTEGDGERFQTGIQAPSQMPFEDLEELLLLGRAQVLGEMTEQYYGIPIDDPVLDPLFALAHKLDIPVHVHLAGLGAGNFPSHLGDPLRLVPVLRKYPGIRVYLENAGWPFLEEVTSVMYQFPSVYADLSTILHLFPRSVALKYVRDLIENGLGKRLMFGSDQMIWPEVIDEAVDVLQSAAFLSLEQKADIFYNNAARFLRLDEEEIAGHRGR